MENIEIITLEDGKDYMITDEFEINKVRYVYLTNEEDIADICIRKINIINNEEYLVGLDSEKEFKNALQEFLNRNKKGAPNS